MKPPRDPEQDKARDLARQRKIASESSDKSSRRNVPLRKAMANREIRRTDKADLKVAALADPQADTIVPDLADRHGMKWKSWGSENAAAHRARQAESQAEFRAAGGRNAVMAAKWQAIADRTDTAEVAASINALLQRLKKD
jgi:hypothetical protein